VRAHLLKAVLSIVAVAGIASCGTGGIQLTGTPHADTGRVSPTRFGPARSVSVTCHDSTSDAAILQRAIDSSPPGAAIQIQGGTCLLTRGIILAGNRTYTGAGTTSTTLVQDAAMAYVLASAAYTASSATTGDPLAIRDLAIACNTAGSTDGIILMNWHADVEHVDVSGCGGSGIVDTATAASGHPITNTSVNSRFDNNFISNSGQYGFYVQDPGNTVTDGFFDNNQIGFSAKDAVHMDNAVGWDISGNHVYGDAEDGIYAGRLYGTTISNNYVEDFGHRQSAGTWYGIVGTAQGDVGSTIFNNKVFNDNGETAGATYIYVAVTQANYSTGYLSVTGNVIVGVRASDVGFSFSGGQNKLVVASGGNVVARVGTPRSIGSNVTLAAGM
jgi:hypothetical protein